MARWCALVAALVLAVSGAPAPGQIDPEAGGDPGALAGYPWAGPDHDPPDTQTLAPYGAWQVDRGYGRFWRPRVAAGWLPYRDGRWVWTSYGWTWVSREPWNWTYHYGRWAFLPAWGWGWFPGSTWGPAWVNWSSYGNWVGWAPLSPWRRPVYGDYLFVPRSDFCAPSLGRRAVRWNHVPRGPRVHWRDHATRGPERGEIERGSRYPLYLGRDRPRPGPTPLPYQPPRIRTGDRPGDRDGPLIHRPDARTPGRSAGDRRPPLVHRSPERPPWQARRPVERPHSPRPGAGARAPLVLQRPSRAPAAREAARPGASVGRGPLVHRGGGAHGQARGAGGAGLGGLHPGP